MNQWEETQGHTQTHCSQKKKKKKRLLVLSRFNPGPGYQVVPVAADLHVMRRRLEISSGAV